MAAGTGPQKVITVTERCAQRIAALQGEEKNRELMLRIAVSGGGCQGFQYGFSLVDKQDSEDHVFKRDGAVVVVDDVSLEMIAGSEVDYIEDLVGSCFAVKNPNAASSCGCGISFSTG